MRDTTAEPIPRAILSLAWPACLSFLLQNLYHVNDAAFLGRVGPDATNAMGTFMLVAVANFGFILTLARGTASLMGRRFGAGNLEGAQRALGQGLRLALLVLVPLGLIEAFFIPDILHLLGGRDGTVTEGVAYVRTLLWFLPALFAAPMLEFALQGLGDTRTPVKLMVLAVAVNTLMNYVLVLPHELSWTSVPGEGATLIYDGFRLTLPFGLGAGELAFGGLGVVGAALATGVSRLLTSALAFRVLVRRKGLTLLLKGASYRADRESAREILRVGTPAGSSTLLFGVVSAVILRIISRYGQDAMGAYAIGFRAIESVSFMIVLGFGAATGTVVAHSVGAGLLDRARRAAHVGVLLCAVPMLITNLTMFLFPSELAGLFSIDPAIVATAAGYIGLMAFCQLPQAVEMVYGDAMAGAGSSMLASLVSIPGNVLRIPAAWILAVEFELGLTGVWYAILGSAILKGIGMSLVFFSGKWEHAMARGRRSLSEG